MLCTRTARTSKGDKRKMKVIGAVTIGKLIEAHYEKDEHKFKSYAEFIAEAYNEMGEERAERIIRSRIDGSYKDKPVVGFDEVMELGRMTREEIEQKTSLCFLLNPNIPEEEKICVIEKVMATKATIVPKAALCNIITHLLKQNAELKSKNCWKTCEYAEPKSQWISQHIQDVEQLANAKEIIKYIIN